MSLINSKDKASAIEKFKSSARLNKLDNLIAHMQTLKTASAPRLSKTMMDMLLIVYKIEKLVMVTYADEVERMSSWNVAGIREFTPQWKFEEERHGNAFKEYARIHGLILAELMPEDLGKWYQAKVWLFATLSHWFPKTGPVVHMVAGTINEITAHNIYKVFSEQAGNDPLLKDLLSAIATEEVRHFAFYKNMAKELLASRWKIVTWLRKQRVRMAVWLMWTPVGSGNDNVGFMAEVLLAEDNVAENFYREVTKMMRTITDFVPNVPKRFIRDIEKLRTA